MGGVIIVALKGTGTLPATGGFALRTSTQCTAQHTRASLPTAAAGAFDDDNFIVEILLAIEVRQFLLLRVLLCLREMTWPAAVDHCR